MEAFYNAKVVLDKYLSSDEEKELRKGLKTLKRNLMDGMETLESMEKKAARYKGKVDEVNEADKKIPEPEGAEHCSGKTPENGESNSSDHESSLVRVSEANPGKGS